MEGEDALASDLRKGQQRALLQSEGQTPRGNNNPLSARTTLRVWTAPPPHRGRPVFWLWLCFPRLQGFCHHHSWIETLPDCTSSLAPPTMSLMIHWENVLLSLPVIRDSVVPEVLEPKGEIFKRGHTIMVPFMGS